MVPSSVMGNLTTYERARESKKSLNLHTLGEDHLLEVFWSSTQPHLTSFISVSVSCEHFPCLHDDALSLCDINVG